MRTTIANINEIKKISVQIFKSVNVSITSVQQDVSHGGRHPLPSIATFITVLDHLGIYKDIHVVVSDHAAGANAAARFGGCSKVCFSTPNA